MLKKATIITIIVLSAFAAMAGPVLETGSPAPELSLTSLDNRQIDLGSYLGRKATLLTFFASWSKSCRQELAFLDALHKKYRYKGLRVIGVSYDRKLSSLKEYIAANKIGFTVAHDKKLTTLKNFKILILPTLLVIDKNGNISSSYVDFDENVAEAVEQDLAELLKQ